MTWIVPCVAGCDGPMLTMTSPSARPARTRGGRGWASMSRRSGVMSDRARAAARCCFGIVLAQRVPDEALVEQDRTQVGIAAEDDAVHVVALALHEARGAVQRDERVDRRDRLRRRASSARTRTQVRGGVEVVDDVEARRPPGPVDRGHVEAAGRIRTRALSRCAVPSSAAGGRRKHERAVRRSLAESAAASCCCTASSIGAP